MYLSDVNILVYSFVRNLPDSSRYRAWLEALLDSGERFAVTDLVLCGFLRIVTNPRVFKPAASLDEALLFVERLASHPNCVHVRPGDRHWEIFLNLCKTIGARGNLISDAYLAAIAIESDCQWVTNDRDFARFPGLKLKHPLQAEGI